MWHKQQGAVNEALQASAPRALVFSRARRTVQKEGSSFWGLLFHDMRHLFAVEYLQNNSDSPLKEHLRHSFVKMAELYLEFRPAKEAEAAKRGP